MRRVLVSALASFGIVGIVFTIAGCGGGGGGSPPTPTPAPPPAPPAFKVLTVECPQNLTRGQCDVCQCLGLGGQCVGEILCTSCKSTYVFHNSSEVDGIVPGTCAFQCPSPSTTRLPMPDNALNYNGKSWPTACWDEDADNHFFIIGDWGGVLNGNGEAADSYTFQNRPTILKPIDVEAQQYVAHKIRDLAPSLQPKFFINVGDNAYPGGIGGVCNAVEDKVDANGLNFFQQIFKNKYYGEGVDGKEWWGVLGNHDYGGYSYSVHWDQNIFYSWYNDSNWLTPAQYWHRNVQFRDFTVDFIFLDTNRVDTYANPTTDPGHNICSEQYNVPVRTCEGTSINSPQTCWDFFDDLWETQKTWLADLLEKSTAEWQILVTHYPPTFEPCKELWDVYFEKYGVDLYISGHTHQQEVNVLGGTTYVISGGGGGITSQILPVETGHDFAYGFVDVTITKDHIKLDQYSHGGVNHDTIIMNTTLVSPRYPQAAIVV